MSRYHIAARLIDEVSALETLEELEEDEVEPETPPVSSIMGEGMDTTHQHPV